MSQRSLSATMLFATLPAALRDQLRHGATMRTFEDGQIIQQRGDMADGFWLIEEGSVAVGQFLLAGDFRGIAVLGPGDSWGELALFAGRPRVVDAQSRGRSRVYFIRGTAFEAMLAQHPAVMRQMLGTLSAQLQELLDVMAGIRRGTATSRVASMLATLAGGGAEPVSVAITQQELGELLGLTRATVNLALRDLSDRGLVRRGYRTIVVEAPDRLALAVS